MESATDSLVGLSGARFNWREKEKVVIEYRLTELLEKRFGVSLCTWPSSVETSGRCSQVSV